MDKNNALIVASCVFGFVGLVHLLRVLFRTEITIAGKNIPLWANVIGFIVAFSLSAWMYSAYAS